MDFFKGRSVFITGITGFVGSSLAARLVGFGSRVIGLAQGKRQGSYFHELGLQRHATLVNGDVRDFRFLKSLLEGNDTEVVYHLAGQAIIPTANRLPLSCLQTNVEGTWNLLEACRGKATVQAIVIASSDKVYGDQGALPFKEDLPPQPKYPYDVSMACSDLIAQSYSSTYGMPVVVARFSNLYGPGDLHFSRIVPQTIRDVLKGNPPTIRSDGSPRRDYLYIDDAVDLYLLLAKEIDKTKAGVFNAGSGKSVNVLELVEMILRLVGRPDLKPRILGEGKPTGELQETLLNANKVQRHLGWTPRISLEEGLKRTIHWYADYLQRCAIRQPLFLA